MNSQLSSNYVYDQPMELQMGSDDNLSCIENNDSNNLLSEDDAIFELAQKRVEKQKTRESLEEKKGYVAKKGPRYLIGKSAKDMSDKFSAIKDPGYTCTIEIDDSQEKKSYNKFNGEILAKIGSDSSYGAIINNMIENGEATLETAEKMLENLGKEDSNNVKDLFIGLGKYTKNLMALLICESIRFGDDGFLSRMYMRKVIELFENGNQDAFELVFVGNEINPPYATFAGNKGKQRMNDLIIGGEYFKNNYFKKDQEKMESCIEYLSSLIVDNNDGNDKENEEEIQGINMEEQKNPRKRGRKSKSKITSKYFKPFKHNKKRNNEDKLKNN